MRLLAGVLSFMLLLPSFAVAEGPGENPLETKKGNANQGQTMKRHAKDRVPFEVLEVEIISWSEKYTPEKAAEWKAVLKERQALQDRWLSPEMSKKREAWKKEKREKLAEIRELKKQLEAGKITKEEFLEKAYDRMKEKGAPALKGHATYSNLKAAVERDDAQQAAVLLNEMLEFFKKHNEIVKAKLDK